MKLRKANGEWGVDSDEDFEDFDNGWYASEEDGTDRDEEDGNTEEEEDE